MDSCLIAIVTADKVVKDIEKTSAFNYYQMFEEVPVEQVQEINQQQLQICAPANEEVTDTGLQFENIEEPIENQSPEQAQQVVEEPDPAEDPQFNELDFSDEPTAEEEPVPQKASKKEKHSKKTTEKTSTKKHHTDNEKQQTLKKSKIEKSNKH